MGNYHVQYNYTEPTQFEGFKVVSAPNINEAISLVNDLLTETYDDYEIVDYWGLGGEKVDEVVGEIRQLEQELEEADA